MLAIGRWSSSRKCSSPPFPFSIPRASASARPSHPIQPHVVRCSSTYSTFFPFPYLTSSCIRILLTKSCPGLTNSHPTPSHHHCSYDVDDSSRSYSPALAIVQYPSRPFSSILRRCIQPTLVAPSSSVTIYIIITPSHSNSITVIRLHRFTLAGDDEGLIGLLPATSSSTPSHISR